MQLNDLLFAKRGFLTLFQPCMLLERCLDKAPV